VDAAGFPTDLPRNCTLETVTVSCNELGPDRCRAICESLQEKTAIFENEILTKMLYLLTMDDTVAILALNKLA
jgi:hypothetical protein